MKTNFRKPTLVKIGLCALNNDPIDFKRNFQNIIKSIELCKQKGCKIRIGPELEVSGYACNDHFNEYDTVMHSWEIIAKILTSGITQNIVCSIGMPIIHHGGLYNCHVVLLNNKIVGVRPKIVMADGDNYFESKWFANWKARYQITQFQFPKIIQKITGEKSCPIGEFILKFDDTMLGYEICEESWISKNPMIDLVLDGAEIVVNPSASYIEREKLKRKLRMLKQLSERNAACYCYINNKGSIGERTYFDGGCVHTENGKIKAISELHTMDDVVVTEAIANLTAIRTFRLGCKSFGKGSHGVNKIPKLDVDFCVADCCEKYKVLSPEQQAKIDKIVLDYQFPHATWQPSLFLWDYLRKSHGSGFFLALSGGLDSCSVALIVYNMCKLVFNEITTRNNETVLKDLRQMVGCKQYKPSSSEEICQKLFFTAYMGTQNSSQQTKNRAEKIAKTINANHRCFNFDEIYQACQNLGKSALGIKMQFHKHGGSWRQDLALQNVQARSRMMLAYMFSQMELQVAQRDGFLLVLGSGNLCESLRGYFTKYDCSSADVNPIGSFSKKRLREFLAWNKQVTGFQFIDEILKAAPSAQLRPLSEGEIAQTDEEDMGLSYEELSQFGQLRRVHKMGPVSMFEHLYEEESFKDIKKLASQVKKFFKFYGQNRHKMTVITPAFHYNPQGCDDNRYDMRPILYSTDWSYQFQVLDERVKDILEGELKE